MRITKLSTFICLVIILSSCSSFQSPGFVKSMQTLFAPNTFQFVICRACEKTSWDEMYKVVGISCVVARSNIGCDDLNQVDTLVISDRNFNQQREVESLALGQTFFMRHEVVGNNCITNLTGLTSDRVITPVKINGRTVR